MIRRLLPILLLTACSSAGAAFLTGHDLRKGLAAAARVHAKQAPNEEAALENFNKMSAMYGYIQGVSDSMESHGVACMKGVTLEQIVILVSKHLDAYPDHWQDSADILIAETIRDSFPCGKPKP